MRAFALLAALFLFLSYLRVEAQFTDKNPSKSSSSSLQTMPPVVSEVDGRTFDEWKNDLQHADPSTRAEAVLALVHFGPRTAEAVPLLLKRCLDSDPSPRV